MEFNTIQRLFWIIQIVTFCFAASENVISDPSCPCRPLDECLINSQIVPEDNEASLLYCESENLIRCCATIPESQNVEQREEDDKKDEPEAEVGALQKLIQFMKDRMFSLITGKKTEERTVIEDQTIVPLVQESSPNVPPPQLNIESSNQKIHQPSFTGDPAEKVGMNILQNVNDVMTYMDANQELSQLYTTTRKQEPEYLKREPSPVPQAIRVRIINNFPTEALSSPVRFFYPEHAGINIQEMYGQQENMRYEQSNTERDIQLTTEGSQSVHKVEEQSEVQEIIDEVMNFESFRISPKKRSHENFQFSNNNEVTLLKLLNSEETKRSYENRENDHSNRESKFLSIPGSVPEKMSNFLKQKTSLETLLMLDRVSTQATNENSSNLPSGLDVPKNDDTTTRNLSHPENVGNIKRQIRSRVSESNEESKETRNESDTKKIDDVSIKQNYTGTFVNKSSSNPSTVNTISSSKNQIQETSTVASVRRFKRPPRILPMRIPQNEEQSNHASYNKFVNSRQRTLDLFNRSNEKRKKQSSFIINRSDPKIKNAEVVNNDFSNTEKQNVMHLNRNAEVSEVTSPSSDIVDEGEVSKTN